MSRNALYAVRRSIDDTPLDTFGSFRKANAQGLSRQLVSPQSRGRMRAFPSFRALPSAGSTVAPATGAGSGAGHGAGAGSHVGSQVGRVPRTRHRRSSVDADFSASRRDVLRGLRGDVPGSGLLGPRPVARAARTFPTNTGVCLVRFEFGSSSVVVRPTSLSPFCISCIAPPLALDELTGASASPQLHVALSFNGSEFEKPFAVGIAGVSSGESFYHHRTLLRGRVPRMPSLLDRLPEVATTMALDSSLSSLEEFGPASSHHPVCYRQPTVARLSTASGSVRGGLVVIAHGNNLHSVELHRYVLAVPVCSNCV